MTAPRHVFYISDRTGLTAENIGEALLNQFGRIEFKRHTYPFIDTPEKARTVVEIVNRNAQENGLRPIAFVSVVNDEIREIIKKAGAFHINFFETFLGLLEKELNTALLRLKVNEQWVSTATISETQVNRIALDEALPSPTNLVQIAFMVDATGSMGDELEFLKMDLKKVINEVQKTNTQLKISTATVFYRDEGDEYVVKHSPFTEDINQTTEFISQQHADGGGDFPEAVDKALVQLNQLQWQPEARTRIAFLVLDAPPHNKPAVISSIQYSVKTAAASGIKLIPVVASGIDKTTEFLMRFIAMYTNGTYVFITDHSGIGNKHLEPSVGEYQVEKLSDLMVRLIKKYSE